MFLVFLQGIPIKWGLLGGPGWVGDFFWGGGVFVDILQLWVYTHMSTMDNLLYNSFASLLYCSPV